MVERIDELLASGAAYRVDDDIYFAVADDPDFGFVSSYSREQMLDSLRRARGRPRTAGKRDPLDPLLWQAERPGEPAWDTHFGHGRPGWHIECAAIALAPPGQRLRRPGRRQRPDLPPPRDGYVAGAPADRRTPVRPALRARRAWSGLGGQKMSKSQGNLVFVSRLRDDGHHPMAIRLALLAHHYRADWEWTDADLAAGEDRFHRWTYAATADRAPAAAPVIEAVREALADDLDAPGSAGGVDAWADQVAAGVKAMTSWHQREVAVLTERVARRRPCAT